MTTAIADLERYERDAVATLCSSITWDVRRSREDRIDLLSRLLKIEADGSYSRMDEWGIAAPFVPLLWQLTLQPTLIVDIILRIVASMRDHDNRSWDCSFRTSDAGARVVHVDTADDKSIEVGLVGC